MMPPQRRAGDRSAWASTAAGLFLVVVGVALLAFTQTSEWASLGIVFVGGVLVRGESVVGLARAWRRNGQPPSNE